MSGRAAGRAAGPDPWAEAEHDAGAVLVRDWRYAGSGWARLGDADLAASLARDHAAARLLIKGGGWGFVGRCRRISPDHDHLTWGGVMAASERDTATGRDGDHDGGTDGGQDDGAAWVARVVDALGPLDDTDREVLGRLLNRRS